MSKRTIAGLAAVLVWAINKGLTLAGMPHLAPSIVWVISSLCLGVAAYLTTEAATPGNKLAQKVLAILAIIGAVGVQQLDVPEPATPDEAMQTLQPETAPTTPPALPAPDQDRLPDAGQASGSGDITNGETQTDNVNDFPDGGLVPDAGGQIKEDSNVDPHP